MLEEWEEIPGSAVFQEDKRVVLLLNEFTDDDVKKYTCWTLCEKNKENHVIAGDNKCDRVYQMFQQNLLKNIPWFSKCLIQIFKDTDTRYIGRNNNVTKTKMMLALIFSLD